MAAIVLRIGLTPVVFALVSRAQSRFGNWIGGRLIGLPLTTGPFLLAVCLTSARTTAVHAAAGVVGGQIAVIAFCCAYAHIGRHLPPLRATVGSLLIALTGVVCMSVIDSVWLAAVLLWLAIALSLARWPWPPRERATTAQTPAVDGLAMRATISTAMVITTTALVPVLGPHLAGILSSAPVLLSIMLPSTHRASGIEGAAAMSRGTIISMAATVGFAATLATTRAHLATAPALLLAAAAMGAICLITPAADRLLAQLANLRVRKEVSLFWLP